MMSDSSTSSELRSSRWIYIVGVLIFFGYAAWMIGSYLRSTFVRDAAVTSWSNTATASIDGVVEILATRVGNCIGKVRIVAHIRNDHLSQKYLSEAQAKLDYTGERIAEWNSFLEEIEELDIDRANTALWSKI